MGASTIRACSRANFLAGLDHGRTLAKVATSEAQSIQRLELSARRKRIYKLLQNTASLLPRTLSTADSAAGPDSALFWSNVLGKSITELSSSPGLPLKATIAVAGFDKWACTSDLVTALLEDPFTSDPTYSDILRNRWKNAPSCVNVEYGKPNAFAGELSSPSHWLQQFPHAIRLIELPELSSLSSISDETDNLLLNNDVLLLLCDPITTPLSVLARRTQHLLNKPNTILILTSGSNSDSHRQFVSQALYSMGCQPGHVLFVDPRQALDAVTVLQASPASPSAIDKYQRDTLGSRISTIAVAINEIFSPGATSETPLLDLRQETALSQVGSSLSAGFRSLEATKKDTDRVANMVEELSSGVQRVRENARRDALGEPGEDNKIEKALSLSMKEMNTLLASLSFWKMVWRVDEIEGLVSAAIQGQWCKELENQLILQTGRLESTQSNLSSSAFSLLFAAPLHSPVLKNQLQQLTHSPTHVLTPSSLTEPIHNRRSQLTQYTTTKLQRESQGAVIGALGGILGGAGLGWWLVFGEHVLNLGVGTEVGTAIGSGALLAVGSIRWAVGKWERAKRRWVQDSARVGEGLTRDLQSTIQRTVDDKVTIVAWTACRGMRGLIDRRHAEISQLHGELCDLDAQLHVCTRSPASWTGQSARSVEVDRE